MNSAQKESARDEALQRIRHSAAHVMAEAVQQLHPEAKFAIGPDIATGFYYDMDLPESLGPEDLETIEARMRRIVEADVPFEHEEWDKDRAREFFKGNPFKIELIDEIPDETVGIYKQGGFTDLCAGPHVQRTGEIQHFKLTSVAGAYWRGDEHKPMLQRIYGTAWDTAEALEEHLHRLEEARQRDHRGLGTELELFLFNEVSPGCAFWLPKGLTLYKTLAEMVSDYNRRQGYQEMRTPVIFNRSLWETSGHWDHYHEEMFNFEAHEQEMSMKPMNCPGHMIVYKSRRRSYRELPFRIHDQGILHRNERPGVLSGLTRVRQFSQDDSHIFLRRDQMGDEIQRVLGIADRVYEVLGLPLQMRLSTRPERFMGDPALWDEAEGALKTVLEGLGRPFGIDEGEGTFYGPKIDFIATDALGREWQTATVQVDFQLPIKFDLAYIDEDDQRVQPVVIHHAIYGSFERLIALLIEHHAGAFPTWLAPVQAIVLSVSEKFSDYAQQVHDQLTASGVRCGIDLSNERVGNKVRQAVAKKIPYVLVVGGKDRDAGTVTVRPRGSDDQTAMPIADFVAQVTAEADVSF